MIAFLFFSVALAQQPVCNSGTNQVPFNGCVRNSLYGPESRSLFTSPETACAEVPLNSFQYFQCLCDKHGVISFCYESFCIGDASVQVSV
jgi:hypothetical protein